jgi:hypothetical protein
MYLTLCLYIFEIYTIDQAGIFSIQPNYCIVRSHLSVGRVQSFIEPLTNSLNQFATTIGQAAPEIVAALILLGMGLVSSHVTQMIYVLES